MGSGHGFVCSIFFVCVCAHTAMTFSCNAFIELLETSCDGPCLSFWYLEAKAGGPQIPGIQRMTTKSILAEVRWEIIESKVV